MGLYMYDIAANNVLCKIIYDGKWLKRLNVTIASKMKESNGKDELCENLKAEKGAFTFNRIGRRGDQEGTLCVLPQSQCKGYYMYTSHEASTK